MSSQPTFEDQMAQLAAQANLEGGFARMPNPGEGPEHLHLVAEPELIEEVLVHNAHKYKKNPGHRSQIQRLMGNGMLTSNGDDWKRQRVSLAAQFAPGAIDAHLEWMSVLVQEFLDSWRTAAETGGSIDVEREFDKLIRLLAGVWLVGPACKERADEFSALVEQIVTTAPAEKAAGENWFGFMLQVALQKSLAEMDRFLEEAADRPGAGDREAGGLLQDLLAGDGRGDADAKRHLRDQFFTLFLTASETTATSLCWTLHAIATHEHVKQRLCAELDAVMDGGRPQVSQLGKLQYATRVINESLRLFPPVPSFSRVSLEDQFVGEHAVPEHGIVVISPWVTHRLARHWEDPGRFNPDRFDRERSAGRSPFAFIPFGAGPRRCIGSYMGSMLVRLVAALTLSRYDLTLVPGHVVEPWLAEGTILRFKFGLKMNVEDRTRKGAPPVM